MSDFKETIMVFVEATNGFDALAKAETLYSWMLPKDERFKIAEAIEL